MKAEVTTYTSENGNFKARLHDGSLYVYAANDINKGIQLNSTQTIVLKTLLAEVKAQLYP